MEGERTTREAIEAFMQSELADTVVRRGSEMTFALQVDTWIRTLNFEEWEAYPTYLQEELSIFLEDEINAGRLHGLGSRQEGATEAEAEHFDGVWVAIYNIALDRLTSRQMEVAHGQLEDMRAPMEERPDRSAAVVPLSIAERLQGLMQTVKEFVRGHEAEMPARGQDLER